MKKIKWMLILSFLAVCTVAVQAERVTHSVEPATFPGGLNAMNQWIKKNMKYPQSAKDRMIDGIVYVHFMVDKDGKLGEPSIQIGVHPDLDAEALRLVREMPAWVPATSNSEKVVFYMTAQIDFDLGPYVYITAYEDEDGKQPTDSVALSDPIRITIRASGCEEDIDEGNIILPPGVFIHSRNIFWGSDHGKKIKELTFQCVACDVGEFTYGPIYVGKIKSNTLHYTISDTPKR